MRSFSIVVALALASVSFAGVADAQTCPTPVHPAKVRIARHRPRLQPQPLPRQPSAAEQPAVASFEQYNLDRINAYRRAAGVAPLVMDPQLSAFAREGNARLMRDHVPHGHFSSQGGGLFSRGFSAGAAENQGSPSGWPRMASDPNENRRRQIDDILASMMREGPGGGHHDNMLNPKMKRVGIALAEDSGGRLYLTNDFSG